MRRPRDRRDKPGQSLLFDAERHCVLCGRRLRGDRSVKRQYGPRCWRKRVRSQTEFGNEKNPSRKS